MRWFAKLLASLVLGAVIAGADVHAQDSKPRKPAEKDGKNKDSKEGFVVPIPPGHEATGLRFPYFENGKLRMFLNMDVARRTDEDFLAMTNAVLETYDDTGTPEMSVQLSDAVLNLKTRVVNSLSPVTIRRSDFEITGDKARFNTRTRVARFMGNVRMLIYNRSDLSTEEPNP